MKVLFSRWLGGASAVLVFFGATVAAGYGQSAAGSSAASGTNSTTNSQSHAESVVVFPFENAGHEAKMDWLGEGLAELATDRLIGHGRIVFSREERLAALEKLGLPAYSRFSRATMLKIAAEIDADYVVFGEFAQEGSTVRVTARVLGINPPRLSTPLEETGGLDSLAEIQAKLSWRVLCQMQNTLDRNAACDSSAPAAQQFVRNAKRVRADALQYFVWGLESPAEETRLRDLRDAARLDPEWDEPVFAIGQTYYAHRDCESASSWFTKVPPGSAHLAEANFDVGVCHLLRNDPIKAEATFKLLAERMKTSSDSPTGESPGVLSNLGTALLRQGRYADAAVNFTRAKAIDPGEPDYWFNLGLAQYLLGDWEKAAQEFREALRLQPEGAETRELFLVALDKNGSAEEAAELRKDSPPANETTTRPGQSPTRQDVTKMSATSLAKFARIRMELMPGVVR
jgi:tetratricopeptide (TPR) repeat protein